jgi:predicted acetyltransferase
MSTGRSQLDVRYARMNDIREVAGLWCEAFPSRRTLDERARMLKTGGRYGGLETTLVGRADGRLIAACKLYRFTQFIAGVPMPMMGLAAVAVAAHARRQGVGAVLCVRAMDAARERGDLISTLYPFRADYYERLGWGLVGELHDYRFATSALPDHAGARYVRPAGRPGDADAIADCYARVAERSNGPIRRDTRVWEYRLAGEELGVRPVEPRSERPGVRGGEADPRQVVVHDREGVTGYALLRHRPRLTPRAIQVRELVAEDEEAYRALLGHLARQSQRWPIARHTARLEERFGDRLADPRAPNAGRARSLYFPTARIIRGPMLRILDVPRALGLRRYYDANAPATAGDATIEIRVDDEQVPANRGPWLLRLGAHGAAVAAADGGEGDTPRAVPPDARLRTDAATLARVFAGDIAPSDLPRIARGTVDGDIRLMDAAFATRERCWLLDEF